MFIKSHSIQSISPASPAKQLRLRMPYAVLHAASLGLLYMGFLLQTECKAIGWNGYASQIFCITMALQVAFPLILCSLNKINGCGGSSFCSLNKIKRSGCIIKWSGCSSGWTGSVIKWSEYCFRWTGSSTQWSGYCFGWTAKHLKKARRSITKCRNIIYWLSFIISNFNNCMRVRSNTLYLFEPKTGKDTHGITDTYLEKHGFKIIISNSWLEFNDRSPPYKPRKIKIGLADYKYYKLPFQSTTQSSY